MKDFPFQDEKANVTIIRHRTTTLENLQFRDLFHRPSSAGR
jgi:hypothetical protein